MGHGALAFFEPVAASGVHGFFELLQKQPVLFLLIALALGHPLGRVSVFGISLGSTAGTLLTGVVIAIIASAGFGLRYEISELVSTIFLLMFMYALGPKVGLHDHGDHRRRDLGAAERRLHTATGNDR